MVLHRTAIKRLKLPSLELRRLYNDLMVLQDFVLAMLTPVATNFLNQAQLCIPEVTRTNCSRDSNVRPRSTFFSERVVNAWNNVPCDIVSFISLNAFKCSIERADFTTATSKFVCYCFSLGLVLGLLLVHFSAF